MNAHDEPYFSKNLFYVHRDPSIDDSCSPQPRAKPSKQIDFLIKYSLRIRDGRITSARIVRPFELNVYTGNTTVTYLFVINAKQKIMH